MSRARRLGEWNYEWVPGAEQFEIWRRCRSGTKACHECEDFGCCDNTHPTMRSVSFDSPLIAKSKQHAEDSRWADGNPLDRPHVVAWMAKHFRARSQHCTDPECWLRGLPTPSEFKQRSKPEEERRADLEHFARLFEVILLLRSEMATTPLDANAIAGIIGKGRSGAAEEVVLLARAFVASRRKALKEALDTIQRLELKVKEAEPYTPKVVRPTAMICPKARSCVVNGKETCEHARPHSLTEVCSHACSGDVSAQCRTVEVEPWKLSPATNRPALSVNGKRNEG